MNWYYAEAGQQKGPVSDSDLAALAASGTVQPETLVWREGLAQWQPYRDAHSPIALEAAPPPPPRAGALVCAECGRAFQPDEVIRHGNAFICAACKPVFLQKLKEGVSVEGGLNYAGFGIRFGAKLLDSVLLYVVNFSLNLTVIAALGRANLLRATLLNFILGNLIAVSYATWFVGKFGATPGKMATRLRIVNPDGTPVSYGKAFARYFAEWVSSLTLMIGYLMVLWDGQRRALHDRIVGTRVIRVAPR